jgi:hypothetical protein
MSPRRFSMEDPRNPYITEFICSDCNVAVFAFGAIFVRLPPRCATCEWISDLADPDERARLRAFLAEHDT